MDADTIAADWKHIDFLADPGAIVGCDVAGIVTEIGGQVQAKVFKGDHIYGFVHGANAVNHEDGCFAEYAVLKDGLFVHVPASLSDEAACTLAVGLATCAQGLYQSLELPWPDKPTKAAFPVLIYGGSTATGMLAIQLAKLSGLTVVTTASKRNFQLLKDYGADEVFDYNDPECGAKIREYTKNSLHYVFDCITENNSFQVSADALASSAPASGLHYSGLLSVNSFPRSDVKTRTTAAYTAIGNEFVLKGNKIPAMPDHYDLMTRFFILTGELVATGKLRPARFTVSESGIDGILDGLQELRNGKVSGTKLVYKIASS